MDHSFFADLTRQSLNGQELDGALCGMILSDASLELLPLLQAAFQVRKHYFGREVTVHIINNAQNGHCQEDCHYCAQAKSSQAPIEEYGIKSDREILQEARLAYSKGAWCYCMVFAGRRASQSRIERLKQIISRIKSEFPDKEICVSTGFVSKEGAEQLKKAGLDRLNHNLNTSEAHYPNICTTHTFADRLNTLLAAKSAGLKICSGVIIGMGEGHADIIDMAKRLRDLGVQSIPVNLLIPIEGNQLCSRETHLTPEFILRILCLFRFVNPSADIRIAAGRELHLRSMQALGLYPANSLFLQGYLNAQGNSDGLTLGMIKDAGFSIKSEVDLDGLLKEAWQGHQPVCDAPGFSLKTLKELRPVIHKQ